jgi:hypothetical protein
MSVTFPFLAELANFVIDMDGTPVMPLMRKTRHGTWEPRHEAYRILETLKPKERLAVLPGLIAVASALSTNGPPRILHVSHTGRGERALALNPDAMLRELPHLAHPDSRHDEWIAALTYCDASPKFKILATLLLIALGDPPAPWCETTRFLKAVRHIVGRPDTYEQSIPFSEKLIA